jgi:hypothetical protein
MDRRQLSHDILNILERLRIMHDLAFEAKFDDVSKDELSSDFQESLESLEEKFKDLLQ